MVFCWSFWSPSPQSLNWKKIHLLWSMKKSHGLEQLGNSVSLLQAKLDCLKPTWIVLQINISHPSSENHFKTNRATYSEGVERASKSSPFFIFIIIFTFWWNLFAFIFLYVKILFNLTVIWGFWSPCTVYFIENCPSCRTPFQTGVHLIVPPPPHSINWVFILQYMTALDGWHLKDWKLLTYNLKWPKLKMVKGNVFLFYPFRFAIKPISLHESTTAQTQRIWTFCLKMTTNQHESESERRLGHLPYSSDRSRPAREKHQTWMNSGCVHGHFSFWFSSITNNLKNSPSECGVCAHVQNSTLVTLVLFLHVRHASISSDNETNLTDSTPCSWHYFIELSFLL